MTRTSGNSRRWIVREVDNSLRRLGTDWIDLYQVHRPDPDTDVEETLIQRAALVATRLRPRACMRDGVSYGRIISSWSRQHKISPLTAARLAHGLTQKQVADRWNELWPDPERPKSHKQISYWETGDRQPGRDSLNKLAFLYRCSAGVLLGGEDYSHLDPAAHVGVSSVQLLSVSLAVVLRVEEVLRVCRRDNTEGLFWGWPTGVVKPGRDPAYVAVTETLAEPACTAPCAARWAPASTQ